MARKRDREVTPETDQSSGDDEAAEEEELTSEPALLKLTKENLLALARKLKVSKVETLRTKAAIIAAILAAKQLETNAGRDTQGNPDLKLWLELLEPYTGKLDCPGDYLGQTLASACAPRFGAPFSGVSLLLR